MEEEFMNCNVCGAEIPAGAATCPVCGAPAPAAGPAQGGFPGAGSVAASTNPFGADQANQAPQNFGGYDPNQGAYNPNQGAYDPFAPQGGAPTQAPAAPKKSHTGLIIGIIAGVAVVAALIICWALGVFGGGSGADGTYKFSSADAYGMTLDADTMKGFGVDVSDFYIKINGSKASINLMGQGGDCDVTISGSTITFTEGSKEITGKYDSAAGTITIEESGVSMTFKK